MDIRPEEVEHKEVVGRVGGDPVIEVALKGGLYLLFRKRGRSLETLGTGSHRAVARFIAKKKSEEPVEFTDLSKADWVSPEHFLDVLPYYEALTDAYRARQGL